MNLQPPEFFLTDLIEQINKAKREVLIESMLFESGRVLDNLIPAISAAAKRGVSVRINIDWVARKYIQDDLPFFSIPFTAKSKLASEIQNKNKEIVVNLRQDSNIEINETNKPNFLKSKIPFVGRNHMKIYIVDEMCWIGGINLSDISFSKIDFVMRFENKNLTEEARKIFLDNFENRKYKDCEIHIDNLNLLIDGGKRGKSIIYENALGIILEATKNIVFMSQFVPDGKILRLISEKAKLGVEVEIITSPKEDALFSKYPEKIAYVKFLRITKNIPKIKLTHLRKSVHAKLIISDEKMAIFGSHNFVMPGVNFGTKEIAVSSSDVKMISEIKDFLKGYKAFDNE